MYYPVGNNKHDICSWDNFCERNYSFTCCNVALRNDLKTLYCAIFVAARMGSQAQFNYNLHQSNGAEGKMPRRGMCSLCCVIGFCLYLKL